MKRYHTCQTCAHFRPGAVASMARPAPVDSDSDIGVCEADPPIPMKDSKGYLIGYQPTVHASRSCVDYVPHVDCDDDHDDQPPPANVRHLRPVTDLPPAA
jgi:hypothetical protein